MRASLVIVNFSNYCGISRSMIANFNRLEKRERFRHDDTDRKSIAVNLIITLKSQSVNEPHSKWANKASEKRRHFAERACETASSVHSLINTFQCLPKSGNHATYGKRVSVNASTIRHMLNELQRDSPTESCFNLSSSSCSCLTRKTKTLPTRFSSWLFYWWRLLSRWLYRKTNQS